MNRFPLLVLECNFDPVTSKIANYTFLFYPFGVSIYPRHDDDDDDDSTKSRMRDPDIQKTRTLMFK
jgi:hypothetical protein